MVERAGGSRVRSARRTPSCAHRNRPPSGRDVPPALAAALVLTAGWALSAGATELTMDDSHVTSVIGVNAVAVARDWPRPALVAPALPDGGIVVGCEENLQRVIEGTKAGGVIVLAPGIHPGPVVVDRPITLWGPRDAIIRSDGVGHTITVEADGVSLLGFTVEGSGGRFDQTDAAICLRADDCRVEGLTVRQALFGITAEQVRGARIIGNEVVGTGLPDLGLRGDGIRLWEVRGSEVSGNLVSRSRDIVVWYSPGNRVTGNFVEWGRYGTHYMYSRRNIAQGNTYVGNLVGIFVMYSDSVSILENRMAFSDPTGGLGLGVKESGGLIVRDNVLLSNQAGIYLDTSPLQRNHENIVTGNRLLFCGTGVSFHRSETRNQFHDNEFRGCGTPVRVGGGGDAAGVDWRGNYFDDYQGYDLDGDGIGDVAYELHRLSDQLTTKYEALQFFEGTPALGLIDVVGRVLPLFAPRILVHDPAPRLAPPPRRAAMAG